MLALPPSEILAHAPLTPAYFGVAEGTVSDGAGGEVAAVDVPGNVVYNTCLGALTVFESVVADRSDVIRAKLALIYYSLARLYGHLADEKAMFVGLITQRGGQTSTPLGSHGELMRAAERNYREAMNLYPDAPWPPLSFDTSGGTISPKRTYGP